MNLKIKFAILFFGVFVVPLSIFCFLSYQNYTEEVTDTIFKELQIVVAEVDKKTQFYIDSKINLLEHLSKDSEFNKIDYSEDDSINNMLLLQAQIEKLSKWTRNLNSNSIAAVKDIHLISIWDKSGRIVAASNQQSIGIQMPEFYNNEITGNSQLFWGYRMDPSSQKSYLLFTQRLHYKNALLGTLCMQIPINGLIQHTDISKHLGATFEILFPFKKDNYVNYIRKPKFSNFSPRFSIGSKRGLASQLALQMSEDFGLTSDYNQESVFAAWSPSDRTNWSVVAKINKSDVWNKVHDYRNYLLLIWTAFLLFGLVAFWLFSNSITVVLNKLIQNLNQIAQGKEGLALDIQRNDELGLLAKAAQKSNWFQQGVIKLNNCIKEANTLEQLSNSLVVNIAEHINAQLGVLYRRSENGYELQTILGANKADFKMRFDEGEDLMGKVCFEKKSMVLNASEHKNLNIKSSFSNASDFSIVILPILFEEKVIAVFEFGSLHKLNELQISFLHYINDLIASSFVNFKINQELDTIRLEAVQQVQVLDESAIVSETDRNGIITYVNDKFCEISGYQREELIGKNHRILKSNLQPQGIFVGMWKAISMGRTWNGEIVNKKKGDLGYYWVDTTIKPFLDKDGNIEKFVAIRFDITLQKEQQSKLKSNLDKISVQAEELQIKQEALENINLELEKQANTLQANEEELRVQQEELLQSNSELEEKSQSLAEQNIVIEKARNEIELKAQELAEASKYKSEFLANMSHELRTPLNSILLLSKLLFENQEKNLKDNQIEFADVIHKSGKGLLDLINEILDLSKIESGKMDINYDEIHLAEYFKSLHYLFAPIAANKGINLEFDCDALEDNLFCTDKLKMDQILKNLIGNALKFTIKGGVRISVKIDAETICIAVKDTGIGIAADKQRMIFEAFKQADGSTRRKYGGTGLGLSISRELAVMLGGKILIESQEGVGSVFSLELPSLYNNKPLPVEAAAEGSTADKLVLSEPVEPIADDRNNIIADDRVLLLISNDKQQAEKVKKEAQRQGIKLLVSLNATEALADINDYLPFGLILHLESGQLNAWDTLKQIKQDRVGAQTPLVLISKREISIQKAVLEGAVDCLSTDALIEKLPATLSLLASCSDKSAYNVLVVDANTPHRNAIKSYISAAEIQCQTASEADSAWYTIQNNTLDAIIVDIGLPDKNVYKLLDEIRSVKRYSKLPVIIYTGKKTAVSQTKKIKNYAESMVLYTAETYQQIKEKLYFFLHLVEREIETAQEEDALFTPSANILNNISVLVVDDDIRNVFSLTKLLEMHKVKVMHCANGQEALQKLEKYSFDVVLMDMMMPVMDGYTCTKKIRTIEKFRNLPIIALTAKVMQGDRQKCLEAGASDYISKPLDADQLISLMKIWVQKK